MQSFDMINLAKLSISIFYQTGGKMMIKRFFIVLILFIFLPSAEAIDVGGHITVDTVWDNTNEAYQLTGDIYIDSEAKLTLTPGVKVRFNDNNVFHPHVYHIFVSGTLEAAEAFFDMNFDWWSQNSSVVVRDDGVIYLSDCKSSDGQVIVEDGGEAELSGIINSIVLYKVGSGGSLAQGSSVGTLKIEAEISNIDSLTIDELHLSSTVTVRNCTIDLLDISDMASVLTGNTINKTNIHGGSPSISNNVLGYTFIYGGAPLIFNNTLKEDFYYISISEGSPSILENALSSISISGGSPSISNNTIDPYFNLWWYAIRH